MLKVRAHCWGCVKAHADSRSSNRPDHHQRWAHPWRRWKGWPPAPPQWSAACAVPRSVRCGLSRVSNQRVSVTAGSCSAASTYPHKPRLEYLLCNNHCIPAASPHPACRRARCNITWQPDQGVSDGSQLHDALNFVHEGLHFVVWEVSGQPQAGRVQQRLVHCGLRGPRKHARLRPDAACLLPRAPVPLVCMQVPHCPSSHTGHLQAHLRAVDVVLLDVPARSGAA